MLALGQTPEKRPNREFRESALAGARMPYNRRPASFQSAYRPAIEGQPRTRDWGPQGQASRDWGIRAHSRSFAVSTGFSIRG